VEMQHHVVRMEQQYGMSLLPASAGLLLGILLHPEVGSDMFL
jgi:hypothetical protein